MDVDKPVSGELIALMPVLAETMKYALQAIRESSALHELLIEKGVLTKEEVAAKMRSTEYLYKQLADFVGKNWKPS